MREIKFRLWSRHNEKFLYVDDLFSINKGLLSSIDEEDHIPQQYTGLKDKNGKDIYEGDIIQWSIDWRERKAEVKYGIGEFDGGVYKYAGFYLEGDGRILEPYEITNMIKHKEYYSYKVVGNIFEGVDE